MQRPSPLARIFHVSFNTCEGGILSQRPGRQLEKPGSDDAAVRPERGDRREVETVLAGVHQLEAFGVRLHEAIFDPVVDHLHVVAGSVAADPQISIARRQCQKNRLEIDAHVLLAADHQAVAFREAPHAAARAGIDVMEIFGAERLGTPHIVVEICVAPIDDDVAWRQDACQGRNGRLGRIAGRHHHPDRAGWRKRGDKRFEVGGAARPGRPGARGGRGVAIVGDDLVPARHEPRDHVQPHLSESDEPELHRCSW